MTYDYRTRNPPIIAYEVNSFAHPFEYPERLIDLLQASRRLVVLPQVQRLHENDVAHVVELVIARSHARHHVELTADDAGWAQVLELVRRRSLASLEYGVYLRKPDGTRLFGTAQARVALEFYPLRPEFWAETARGVADVLRCEVGMPFYTGGVGQEQDTWVEAFRRAAVDFDAATGVLTIDRLVPAYDAWAGRGGLAGLRECDKYLRGYYWGNVLGREHIAALGGFTKMRAEAPCHRVEQLLPADQLAYLQLTPSIDSFSDRELQRLRDYFKPLLRPKVYPGYEMPSLSYAPVRVFAC